MSNEAISGAIINPLDTPLNHHVIESFKACYSRFDQKAIDNLGVFYADNIVFTDAIHSIVGLPEVKKYFSSMCDNLISCRFEFVGETLATDSAWFKWVMHYQHSRLQKGKMLQLTGATYIQFDTSSDASAPRKIIAHEDFYDMGAMLYEHTPLLGSMIRWLKNKLAQFE